MNTFNDQHETTFQRLQDVKYRLSRLTDEVLGNPPLDKTPITPIGGAELPTAPNFASRFRSVNNRMNDALGEVENMLAWWEKNFPSPESTIATSAH